MLELSRKEEELIDALRDVTILIADSKPSRRILRGFLADLGLKPGQLRLAETAKEACHELELNRPRLVFADFEIGGHFDLSLKRKYEGVLRGDGLSAFFAIGNDDSAIMVNTVADEGVDGYLLRPLSPIALKNAVLPVLERKLRPGKYQRQIHKGRAKQQEGQKAEALALFEQAHRLDPAPALALAHEGGILLELGHFDAAEARFARGLSLNSTHYRCLLGMFDLCFRKKDFCGAYLRAKSLAAHHSVPLSHLPAFIEVSVRNHQFADVLNFVRLAEAVGSNAEDLRKTLVAGLVVAGLSLARKGDLAHARVAFLKAERVSPGDSKVLARIYCAFLEFGLHKDAQTMSSRVPRAVLDSTEVRLAEYRGVIKEGNELRALQSGIQLIQAGVREIVVFESVIAASVHQGRREALILSLVELAAQAFPEQREHFRTLGTVGSSPPLPGR